MAVTKEQILIDIKTIGEMKNLANAVQNLKLMERQGINTTKQMGRMEEYASGLGVTTGQLTSSFGRFKMELLGVMFFGMSLQKTFADILDPARKLVGVQEVWSDLLGARLVPAALDELQAVLDINDALDTMSAATGGVSDKVIGHTARVGEAAGATLYWTGQIGLAISSLEKLGITANTVGLGVQYGLVGIGTAAVAELTIGLQSLRDEFLQNSLPAVFEYNKGLKNLYETVKTILETPIIGEIIKRGLTVPGMDVIREFSMGNLPSIPERSTTNNITTNVSIAPEFVSGVDPLTGSIADLVGEKVSSVLDRTTRQGGT